MKRRGSLVEKAAFRDSSQRRATSGREIAVLVALEFTGERRRALSSAARMARDAASVLGNTDASSKDGDKLLLSEIETRTLSHAPSQHDASGDMDFNASLAEFEELARSAGAHIAATLVQRRSRPDAATLVGQGKLEEIVGVVASAHANVLLFDHDLTPSQLRNLEAKLACRVIDRTQLILDIFARHARSREGQLQVELAQLEYQLPRLAGRGKSMSQLGGGIGTRGPGETQLETDRRKINLRIDHVKQQLESVRRIRGQQRRRREDVPVPVVALVGYTNAGKSTLFNALSGTAVGAGVLESAKMFATLDPKLRQLQLPSRRKILLSDTVGFIRNLPHTLVTSFRATLEEVERAEVLLHVRDASSAMSGEQKLQVEKVLSELNAKDKPVIEVLNKIDLLQPEERARLASRQAADGPVTVSISGMKRIGLSELLTAIDEALMVDPLIDARFRVPQSEGAVLAALESNSLIMEKTFTGNLVSLKARGPASLMARYRKFREREEG